MTHDYIKDYVCVFFIVECCSFPHQHQLQGPALLTNEHVRKALLFVGGGGGGGGTQVIYVVTMFYDLEEAIITGADPGRVHWVHLHLCTHG